MSARHIGALAALCVFLVVGVPSAAFVTAMGPGIAPPVRHHAPGLMSAPVSDVNVSPVQNFSVAVQRLVTLVAAAGGGLLSLVWARVALSWFSHDSMKKVLAKERARDALVGTLLFVAAITGLVWALAHWVLTGS